MTERQSQVSLSALGDVRVLDLAGVTGLYCTKLLAELGADVIKIEPPEGDPSRNLGPYIGHRPHPEKSLLFFYFNTCKRGITLNLETMEGRKIFKRLVKNADILVETFLPGYLGELGLNYQRLARINRRLIMTSITGFGQTGPYSKFKWCDLIGVAMGGLMWLSGFPEDPPNYAGGYQGFNLAGVNGAIGTLLALCRRDLTGRGSHVDVSMQEAVIPSTELAIPAYVGRGIIRKRTGRQVYRGWNELYPCKNGYVMCSPFGAAQWREVLQWADSEGLAADLKSEKYAELLDLMADVQMDRQASTPRKDRKALGGRDAEISHVEDVWETFLKSHTKQELYSKCQAMGVALMPVYDVCDQLEDPHLLARTWFTSVEHTELGRTLVYPGAPYRLSETPWSLKKRSPLIGEHNSEIYQNELGLSPDDLVSLKRKGVI